MDTLIGEIKVGEMALETCMDQEKRGVCLGFLLFQCLAL
ncbi:MAG: hypothetical protein CM1200mP10_07920 [Candidatus Neomarinimicrobiota bacterium]|nr:MAG: hypothetical protein CM1200mP10_07920 [Candidatus Neomarinimicrobiota bacterium]